MIKCILANLFKSQKSVATAYANASCSSMFLLSGYRTLHVFFVRNLTQDLVRKSFLVSGHILVLKTSYKHLNLAS